MSTQVSLYLHLTQEARRRHAEQTGRVLPVRSKFLIDLASPTPEERATILAVFAPTAQGELDGCSFGEDVSRVPLTTGDWLAVAAEVAAMRRAKEAEKEREAAERGEREARQRTQAEASEAQKRAAKEARAAERRAWISEHGSDFLQRAVAAGYNCQRRYVEERCHLELPGFELDWKNTAKWMDRSCPSEAGFALSLTLQERGLGARVVWLTRPLYAENGDDDRYDESEECEAVVVEGSLGQYLAVLTEPYSA